MGKPSRLAALFQLFLLPGCDRDSDPSFGHLSHPYFPNTDSMLYNTSISEQHLFVSRQREDFARKQANALVSSCDLIAYENLQIRNMVRNRKLAKSIHDAGWGIFLQWLARYAFLHDIPVIAVPPHFTSQKCSDCGTIVQKSLSIRTHICHGCGVVLDRDHNAALNILHKALSSDQNGTEGRSGTNPTG